jgi:hypothetical protein
MTIQSTTLRPGLLVSLKTQILGNVSYTKKTIQADHITDDGTKQALWETERVITNPEEHERAKVARSKASTLVRSVCSYSAFGLLCPESDVDALAQAIEEARKVADEFNRTAELTRVSVYVITGRVAPDDVEAVRAINSEVRELLTNMAEGIERLDVKAVRDAADRAKQLGNMLPPETAARVQTAIDTAREAARKIVKAGETVAREIDTASVRRITEMRTTFLELDEIETTRAPSQAPARAVDFEPEHIETKAAPVQPQFDLEV